MKSMKTQITIATITLALISGCSSNKESIMPKSDVTMSEIYQNHQSANSVNNYKMAVNVPLSNKDSDIDAYQLHGLKRNEYKTIPNPTLYMYVNYRISEVDRVPVPAFMTEFKMFDKDEYALPSEINVNWGQD